MSGEIGAVTIGTSRFPSEFAWPNSFVQIGDRIESGLITKMNEVEPSIAACTS